MDGNPDDELGPSTGGNARTRTDLRNILSMRRQSQVQVGRYTPTGPRAVHSVKRKSEYDNPNSKRRKITMKCFKCGNCGHKARECHFHQKDLHNFLSDPAPVATSIRAFRGGFGGVRRGQEGARRGHIDRRQVVPRDGSVHETRNAPMGDTRLQRNAPMGGTRLQRNAPIGDTRLQRNAPMGYTRLEFIANSELTLKLIVGSEKRFLELINSKFNKEDMYALVLVCIVNISQSPFFETKSELLIKICHTNFIANLKQYLMDLPYVEQKSLNGMYWDDQDSFWKNIFSFVEFMLNTSPVLAMKECRTLVEGVVVGCLASLKLRHDYEMSPECVTKLAVIRKNILDIENNKKSAPTQNENSSNKQSELPPEDFRQLTLYPTKEDLLYNKPFVRPNIVDGAYQDLYHYLDVQFRLLREDCFGPLRSGLYQFVKDPNQKMYDNIRVLHDVKFVRTYVSDTKVGLLVQLNVRNRHYLQRLVRNAKRFIFGTLVLFTKDHCKNLIVGTVLDRNEEYLLQGLIPISVVHGAVQNLENDPDTYTMIESDVYFEPYYNVLRALQQMSYQPEMAMKKYIVDIDPLPKHPSYLTLDTIFEYSLDIKKDDIEELFPKLYKTSLSLNLLKTETWPSHDKFQLDQTQFEALKLALTHEFAVIQGPPGTGKTHVGIKIAQTLYNNLKHEVRGCLMLVVCYTNHALDQFLEAIMKFSDSVVRIGGRSQNPAMADINLSNLRKTGQSDRFFLSQKFELKDQINSYRSKENILNVLLNGVIKLEHIKVPGIEHLLHYYVNTKDPLTFWLFQRYQEMYYNNDIDKIIAENDTDASYATFEKQTRSRHGVNVEEEAAKKDECDEINKLSVFSLQVATKSMIDLITEYKKRRDEDGRRNIRAGVLYTNALISLYNDMKFKCESDSRPPRRTTPQTNFDAIPLEDRWRLYFSWIQPLITKTKDELSAMKEQVESASTRYEEARMIFDTEIVKQNKVVGMTTTGAAKLYKMLQEIAPPIVIIEEAAEVFEQHVITSITKQCKHLILIGDHQQLRPTASSMKLAKHFNMEVSLFERMINNGIQSRRLGVQHRMRPEIAALITPHIYESLENHPSVYNYPDVRGITRNLFFFTHDYKEQVITDEDRNRTNHQEAHLVLALANYLMKQDYESTDVTILTTYKGQMFYMRKESAMYRDLEKINITTVDNYQGEESKIILLSLVRNNDENQVGFLSTPNRVCVALSRAKHGLYVFGNIDILKCNSPLWTDIATTLESNNALGSTLTLRCENHTDVLTQIAKTDDFLAVSEGGCGKICNFLLPKCGHKCELICHGYDRGHKTTYTRCKKQCERILCEFQHVCPLSCAAECQPCKVQMLKTLPCGHEQQLYCYLEVDDPKALCMTKVDVTLPDCNHKNIKSCHEDIKEIKCQSKCENRLEKCGHSCMLQCHVNSDPYHEKYECRKKCAKLKNGCSLEEDKAEPDSVHWCPKKCYEECDDCEVKILKKRTNCKHLLTVACKTNADEIDCENKCSRMASCGKHFCNKKCKEDCGDCNVMVEKEIPDCGHVVKMKCSDVPNQSLCTKKCKRIMSCGHKCTEPCRNKCDVATCKELSDVSVKLPCGHMNKLPCNLSKLSEAEVSSRTDLMSMCGAACGAELACGHACGGACGLCRAGRLHVPCRRACTRLNICGHQCEQPCSQVCPPCRKQCEIKCEHSRCNKLCGEPCTPCKERCRVQCSHVSCGRTCYAACSARACSAPCSRSLACGHACRGLCAQPCPRVCNLCDPDNFPRDFFGDPFEDDARFIVLQDCGHIIEVEYADNIVKNRGDIIQLPKCPLCRKPIVNTRRYKSIINELYRTEINPIKKRIHGNNNIIRKNKIQLLEKIQTFLDENVEILKGCKQCYLFLNFLKVTVQKKKRPSKLDFDMGFVCLNVLDMVTECLKTYKATGKNRFKEEINNQVELLCHDIILQLKKYVIFVSQQQQKDLAFEIRRLNSIVQLSKIDMPDLDSSPSTVVQAYKQALKHIFNHFKFDEEKAISSLTELEKALKLSGIIEKQERALIVKAMGMGPGHWYKCPNGHFYCIGECGGANQQSTCPACKATIGGMNHTLAAGNAHAPEMDNSRFAAWSEEYNNMANFNLDQD